MLQLMDNGEHGANGSHVVEHVDKATDQERASVTIQGPGMVDAPVWE